MPSPSILPLGDAAILVRFAETLSDEANRLAIDFAARLGADTPEWVEEIAPGLVSVLVRTRPGTDFWRISGELRLRVRGHVPRQSAAGRTIAMAFDGEDLAEVAALIGLTEAQFVTKHNASPLRVLATGFAPGFVYCGFHPDALVVPRRESVRAMVPAGTVLFAAGQTAIAATPIRTGWHVIGRTMFQNFDPSADPPTILKAGDSIRFEALA
ncbi:MAG: carboxyltransferase domain-containing protein [Devosia sp.]